MDREMEFTDTSTTASKFQDRWAEKNVICISQDADLSEAVNLMKDHHIGDVIVVENLEQKVPVGILTDRDIAINALADSYDVQNMSVSEVMTASPATVRENDDIFEMIRVMKESGVSRLPMVDENGVLCGVITAKRILQCLTEGLSDLAGLSTQQQMNERKHHH